MTDPSLTSSDKSVRSFLAARDSRQERLARSLRAGHPATVFASLNIPGPDKTPAGSAALFRSLLEQLEQLARAFSGSSLIERSSDALGPYAIVALAIDPQLAKQRCIEIETGLPAARLIDLDVYSPAGVQIDRASLGLAARPCLVCQAPAVDCIRLKRHSLAEVIAQTHELLSTYRA